MLPHLGDVTFNGVGADIINDGRLSVEGTVIASSVSTTPNGATFVSAGARLEVGSIAMNGGELSGNGTVDGLVYVLNGGRISPGEVDPAAWSLSSGFGSGSTGTLTLDSLLLGGSGGVLFDFASVTDFDRIFVEGNAFLDPASFFDFSLLNGYAPSLGATFDILEAQTITADLAGLVFDQSDTPGFDWAVSIEDVGARQVLRLTSVLDGAAAGSGNGYISPTVASVPVPAALPLLVASLGVLGLVRHRGRG